MNTNMVKLTEKQVIRIQEMINKYKSALSLHEFDFAIKEDILVDDNGKLAETEIDIFENTMKIAFSKKFLEANMKIQENIIIHELYHGLYLWHKMSARQCNSSEAYDHFEEMFINRITKIFEDWYMREDV